MIRRTLNVFIMLALTAAACASDGGIGITMDEYSVKADPASTESGSVTFGVRNVGAIAHQLLVLRTRRDADHLPVKGGLVRLDARGIDVAAEIELLAADAGADLAVTLEPGPHVLICNIAGHYDLGMHAPFRVR